jgi:hypothetical protein
MKEEMLAGYGAKRLLNTNAQRSDGRLAALNDVRRENLRRPAKGLQPDRASLEFRRA